MKVKVEVERKLERQIRKRGVGVSWFVSKAIEEKLEKEMWRDYRKKKGKTK